MFKCKSTGKNHYYGNKGEVINIGDSYILSALKMGWITGEVEYIGNKFKGTDQTPKTKEGFIIQRVNVERLIDMQNRALNRIEKEITFLKGKKDEIIKLLKGIKKVWDL